MGGGRYLSGSDRKVLWGAAHGFCSFPNCDTRLIARLSDRSTGEEWTMPIGEEAHIVSASADGPRYDPNFPAEKLETYENRILLCSVHHTQVDARSGAAYSADDLRIMKRNHEESFELDERIDLALQTFVSGQWSADDQVRFRQARLDGPRVEEMFVDVPVTHQVGRSTAPAWTAIKQTSSGSPVGAAQLLLHPEWKGHALIVGGPGHGKSTLLQYVCQFHRSRFLRKGDYDGEAQGLHPVTENTRIPIRVDLRRYAEWAGGHRATREQEHSGGGWPQLELYLVHLIGSKSSGLVFEVKDLVQLIGRSPVLLALDGLDEIADQEHRARTGDEIVALADRMEGTARDLSVLVTTRPGALDSDLMRSRSFPALRLQGLTPGLRLMYLDRWLAATEASSEEAERLRRLYQENEALPHIRDLAASPMQLAILLHLLKDRGLLPKHRTELYSSYLETFLDREEVENKEPLLVRQRRTLMNVHAYLAWHMQVGAEGESAKTGLSSTELSHLLEECLADQPEGREFAERLFKSFEGRVLCLVERDGRYEFEVQTLREFFAAMYVHDNASPKGRGRSREDCFKELASRPYWLNVVRFFVGKFTSIEVKGLHQMLTDLAANAAPGLNTHLRIVAARILDDRCFDGQGDLVLRPVVEFILQGTGVVLAEDGFLDEAGDSFTFPEDAGRRIAASVLRDRLVARTDPTGIQDATCQVLRRHTDPNDSLAQWWVGHFVADRQWLEAARALQILDSEEVARLDLSDVTSAAAEAGVLTHTLFDGGYRGERREVLNRIKDELNSGAVELLPRLDRPTSPLEGMAAVAQACMSHRALPAERGTARLSVVDSLLPGLDEAPLPEPDDSRGWAKRLGAVYRAWGDGWILRQAVAEVPAKLPLDDVDWRLGDTPPARLVQREAALRKGTLDLSHSTVSDMEKRLPALWLFGVIARARNDALQQLAPGVNDAVESLSVNDFGILAAALRRYRESSAWRQSEAADALRLGKLKLSPRAMWLLGIVGSDATVEQVENRCARNIGELLRSGERRVDRVVALSSSNRKVPVDSLRGTRGWLHSGDIFKLNLGMLSKKLAGEVMLDPGSWPKDVVRMAIDVTSSDLSNQRLIETVAKERHWFEEEGDLPK